MMPSITRTRRALMPSGGLNALTALDTASMPVSEEPPLANERISVKITAMRATPSVPEPMGTVPSDVVHVLGVQVAEDLAEQPDDDHQHDDAGEQVGGRRERLARLPDSAQVAVAHEEHDGHGRSAW